MKKMACMIAGAAMMSSTMGVIAEEDGGPFAASNFSATLTLTTDYIFRGLSFSGEEPAIQGSFDWGYGNWFAGVWGSSIKGEDGDPVGDGYELELDYYFGYASSVNGFDWSVMPIYYHFPGANDAFAGAETDQFEIWFNVSRTFEAGPGSPTVGLLYAWSPDYTLEDGDGHYVKGTIAFSLPNGFGFDIGVGHQDVEGDKTTPSGWNGPGTEGFDYTHWEFGISKEVVGFNLDLRYHDTNEDSDLVAYFGSDDPVDQRVVFTVSRSF